MARKRLAVTALFLSLIACPIIGHADTDPPDDTETQTVDYWLRNREGWFWYRDPRPPMPKPKPTTPTRPRELADFEAMQRQLDELKRVAVMNPTDANLLAYMRYQRHVMEKSEVFAKRWQHLVWTTPELDYASVGRPTNALAIAAYDEQQRERQAHTVRALANTHALLFIFRSDCPYCHRLAPILKRFEQEYGLSVFPVSLDGRGLPEYPTPQPDNGIAARINVSMVPALYLTAPSRREIQPIGFGVIALTDLVERIAALSAKRPDPL